MQKATHQNKESNCFILAFFNGTKTSIAEIHKVDMSGWQLFECFMPGEKVHYFGWDNNEEQLEWINIAEEEMDKTILLLKNELVKYKKVNG